MIDQATRVLLAADDLDEINLIEEALAEFAEVRYHHGWARPCELIAVEDAVEALEALARDAYDVVLLDLDLAGGQGATALRRIQQHSPETPVIVLTAARDEALAVRLVRQGAQDYLVKSELDCLPLARSIRCAVERNRFRASLRSLAIVDELTGLYSDGGFHRLAEGHLKLARRLGFGFSLAMLELDGLEQLSDRHGHQEKEMLLILAAEILRESFDETDIVTRIGTGKFAAAAILTPERSGPSRLTEVKTRIEGRFAARNGRCSVEVFTGEAAVSGGAAASLDELLRAAEQALCENKRSSVEAAG